MLQRVEAKLAGHRDEIDATRGALKANYRLLRRLRQPGEVRG